MIFTVTVTCFNSLDGINVFQVACICSSSNNQTNSTFVLFPRTWHQATMVKKIWNNTSFIFILCSYLPKKVPNHYPPNEMMLTQDSDLASFFGDLSQMKPFILTSVIRIQERNCLVNNVNILKILNIFWYDTWY